MKKYPEYKSLNLPQIGKEILDWWEKEKIFEKSVTSREGKTPFVFYEGPPSANGLPGIHHVTSRTIKDIFCRYKTLKGFQVKRKAGWDTHGLPVELSVEKELGITKEDIGKKISIADYNKECKKAVLKYKDVWNDLTKKIGFWLDLEHPYITYDNNYIETLWHLLKQLFDKGLLYKGYAIQPYSPAAGTGLSTHELNLPGCYKNVTDTSIVAQFRVSENSKSKIQKLILNNEQGITNDEIYFLAWTTTPWTLPANCALAVGGNIVYQLIKTRNAYTDKIIYVILAKERFTSYFDYTHTYNVGDGVQPVVENWNQGHFSNGKYLPFEIISEFAGKDLTGIKYEQLLPFVKPKGKAFEVIIGDFVTTEDGTGIVHTASVFGADDFRVCKQNGIVSIMVERELGILKPLVDEKGRFVKEVYDENWGFWGEYVREEYLSEEEKENEFKIQKEKLKKHIPNLKEYLSVDERIALKLKLEGKAFKIEKYEHSYPHCWRTDKPVLYYPLNSWFIKTTAAKDKLIAFNNTINWKPEATGTGRFGNWLENLQDWNLSRSRFWGTPLPVWVTEDGKETKCIGSVEELRKEAEKSVEAGFMKEKIPENFDLHRPHVDEVILVSPKGEKMFREQDLIDVWFDSGAMPYAQYHYMGEPNTLPFGEEQEGLERRNSLPTGEGRGGAAAFPADFIAEGVDQTRGWFYTLHAIAVLLFDSVAFKNVVAHGFVLDKAGNKMSKRLGNAADPYDIIEKYGPDATRWYMITNAQPWDNLKFDEVGIEEVRRKFFGTLYNTYTFYALYSNIDRFAGQEKEIPVKDRPEIDRWILSLLNSLIKEVDTYYDNYEPTRAGRAIQKFIDDHLSNWYVRLCRRRFWKGDYSNDKISAYQTLQTCLITVAQLASPIAPFFMDRLYTDMQTPLMKEKGKTISVHLTDFPTANNALIDKKLEERMQIAQDISSMVLSLRKKEGIKVRQPLNKILVPVLNKNFKNQLERVELLVLSEVNVKEIEYLSDTSGILSKKIKPNFKSLGPRYGKDMKELVQAIANLPSKIIETLEQGNPYEVKLNGTTIRLNPEDVEITTENIPGWLVSSMGGLTVALDVNITTELKEEGIARDLVNRIQNLRKEKNLQVTDKIILQIKSNEQINSAIHNNLNYICSETLATSLQILTDVNEENSVMVEINDEIKARIFLDKI